MDQNGSDFSSDNSTLDPIGFSPELFPGSQLVQLVFMTVPTITLCIVAMVAIALAKKIKWKIKILLLNIFAAEVCFSLSLALRLLGFRVRLLINDYPASLVNNLCKVTIYTTVVAGLAKVLSIALYSALTYFFIKINIKKVKWYAIIIPLIVCWVYPILRGMNFIFLVSSFIPKVFVYRGFCSFDLEMQDPEKKIFLIAVILVWVENGVIAGIIFVFAVLTFRIRKNITSPNEKIKKAIAKNLFYLAGGAFFTIINSVATVTFERLVIVESDLSVSQDDIAQSVVIYAFIINFLRSLSSLYIPVICASSFETMLIRQIKNSTPFLHYVTK